MSDEELEKLEASIPQIALDALNAANRRAAASGQPLVLVIGDGLYRVTPAGKELIRMLPPRAKRSDA